MTKKGDPVQVVDGSWYAIASGGQPPFEEICCDCGLSHILEYKIDQGRILVKYTRDDKRTRKERARRRKNKEFLIQDQPTK